MLHSLQPQNAPNDLGRSNSVYSSLSPATNSLLSSFFSARPHSAFEATTPPARHSFLLPSVDHSPSSDGHSPHQSQALHRPPSLPNAAILLEHGSVRNSNLCRSHSTRSARTKSIRRKPVPTMALPMQDKEFTIGLGLPPSHPFANVASQAMTRSSSSYGYESMCYNTEKIDNRFGTGSQLANRAVSAGVIAPVPPHRVTSRPHLERACASSPSTPTRKTQPPFPPPSFPLHHSADPPLKPFPRRDTSPHFSEQHVQQLHSRVPEYTLSVNRPLPPAPTDTASIRSAHTAPLSAATHGGRSSSSADSVRIMTPIHSSTHEQVVHNRDSSHRSVHNVPSSVPPIMPKRLMSDDVVVRSKGSKKVQQKIKVPKKVILLGGETLVDVEFSVDKLVSRDRVLEASTCFVRDENGLPVCFGDLLPPPGPVEAGKPTPKTVVFFIRTFWCGQCQDYTLASISILSPEALEKAGIKVVIIGHGSWKVLKAYRRLFNCPFPIYVDGPKKLYSLMGMTKGAPKTAPWGHFWKGRAEYHQRAVPGQLAHGISNALFKMPVKPPGDLTQLGGEFIFSPGSVCEFAHRMTHASDHMEAPEVIRLAGCDHPTVEEIKAVKLAESQREELGKLRVEMERWKKERAVELEGIKMRKAARRGIPYSRSLEIGPQMAQAHDFEFDFEDGLEVAYEEEDEDETEALEMGEHWDERFRRVISLEQQVSRKDEKETPAGIGKRVMETPLGHEARGQQRDDEVEMISPEGNGNLHVHIGPAS
ncbi:hypothetical protein C366_01898 [Cryptococcus neoformans Tu401-1]|nr:hypothetical protein C366_01898 [Cryptococcus neoformans var. grubii Tu401-1]